jgi:signal transduction histidine kinase
LILGPSDELLDDPNMVGSAREPLVVARRSAVRMLKLVTSMLDFSAIEAGQDARVQRSTDLAQLTRDVAAMFRSTAERAGLRLSVDCPPLAARAYVDREAWERIISNLVSNALKFTPAGTIDVHLREVDESFELTVEDTGIGIAQQDLDEIFSRFYRGSDPRARTHEGSGIGLALVRELVRLHGGTITAHRRRGGGTRMVLRIPARLERSNRLVAEPEVNPGGAAARFVEEASGWLSDDVAHPLRFDAGPIDHSTDRVTNPKVLLARLGAWVCNRLVPGG